MNTNHCENFPEARERIKEILLGKHSNKVSLGVLVPFANNFPERVELAKELQKDKFLDVQFVSYDGKEVR